MTAQNEAGTPCPPQPECRVGSSGEGGKGERPWRHRWPSGITWVIGEREKQISRWSAESDDRLVRGELVEAALHLLTAVRDGGLRMQVGFSHFGLVERHTSPLRRLAIVGALAAAEIDRRLRLQEDGCPQDAMEVLATMLPHARYWIVEGRAPTGQGKFLGVQLCHWRSRRGIRRQRGVDPVGAQTFRWDPAGDCSSRFLTREAAERAIAFLQETSEDHEFRAVELVNDHAKESWSSASWGGFNFGRHLAEQAEWSARTFGPGPRREALCAHIRKELAEVLASDGALEEWIDVVILGLDGAWRSGASPEQIIEALATKQAKNLARTWPDWRTVPADQPIEHVRPAPAPAPQPEPLAPDGEARETTAVPQDETHITAGLQIEEGPARGLDGAQLAGEGEWDPDGDEDDDPPEDSVVELWAAINRYAQACGGDTSDASVSSARMDAVVAVGAAVTARIEEAGNLVGSRKLFRIEDSDRPMHVVAADWQDAIRAWRRELEECDQAADPLGVELVCDSSELRIDGEEVHRDAH